MSSDATTSDRLEITLPRDGGSWGRWCDLLRFDVGERVSAIDLDLTDLAFAEPPFTLRLAAFIDHHAREGRTLDIAPPESIDVANYLSRVGLADDLPAGVCFSVPAVRARDRADVLLEVTRLSACADVNPLVESLLSLLDGRMPATAVDVLTKSLAELADNATEHGAGPLGAYVGAQRYGERLVLAIADMGIGIPAHLGPRLSPPSTSELDVVSRAMQRGVTGVAEAVRGNGLASVVELLGSLGFSRSHLRLWTAGVQLHAALGFDGNVRLSPSLSRERTTGTWATLVLQP